MKLVTFGSLTIRVIFVGHKWWDCEFVRQIIMQKLRQWREKKRQEKEKEERERAAAVAVVNSVTTISSSSSSSDDISTNDSSLPSNSNSNETSTSSQSSYSSSPSLNTSHVSGSDSVRMDTMDRHMLSNGEVRERKEGRGAQAATHICSSHTIN